MENEFDTNDEREMGELHNLITSRLKELAMIHYMIQNAPKDDEGNSVVEIIGIKNFGLFYNYCN